MHTVLGMAVTTILGLALVYFFWEFFSKHYIKIGIGIYLIGVVSSYLSYALIEGSLGFLIGIIVIPPVFVLAANFFLGKDEPEPSPVPTPPEVETSEDKIKKLLNTPTRFEHTHVLGAPGAGKTELLKWLISEDIETNAAVIVMAPKGNLISALARLTAIDSDRLIIVEPDENHPVSLNVFDVSGDTSQAVTLLNYVFSSILETETTNKQTALLNYCIRLLLRVPEATLITLRDLLGTDVLPPRFQPYVDQMNDSGKHFFNNQFGSKGKDGYSDTKGQMRWRLDLLLENPLIEKMFCQPATLVSMKDVMAGGKVLLIDTSIKKLGDFGSSFYGRYFIALIALAAQQRDTTRSLRPVYVYIDEASTYLTDYLESLLDRAREARVGLTLAHQHLKQLTDISTKLEASVHNTAIKIVGRCNDHDSKRMAAEMGLEFADTLKNQPPLSFWIAARGTRLRHIVRPGFLDSLPQRTEREMKQLIARNRERVCASVLPDSEKPTKQSTDDAGTGVSSDW